MYTSPHQFEPLLPRLRLEALRERAASLCQDALALVGKAHPTTLDAVRELVRAMNSYYSNRIEGQSTSPANIERALRREFSPESDTARLQRLALAHIEAEQELEDRARAEDHILSASFAKAAHRALYSRLAPEDRLSEGRLVEPGETRNEDVRIGHHVPASANSLPGFLQRFDEAYDQRRGWDMHVIAAACAHHRRADAPTTMCGSRTLTRRSAATSMAAAT